MSNTKACTLSYCTYSHNTRRLEEPAEVCRRRTL